MKQAGCWIVYLRIESATQTVLDALGKKITIEHLRPAQVGSSRESGHSRLELALKKYAGEGVYLRSQDHLAHEIVKFALERSADSPGYSKTQLANSSRSSVLRRGIVSVLAAIGYFGGRRPQTAAAPFLWSFTKKYNSKPKHCYENAGLRRAPDELTTEEADGVIDESAGGWLPSPSLVETLLSGRLYELQTLPNTMNTSRRDVGLQEADSESLSG